MGIKLMIIAPHQDDETIGCGGLIQKVTEQGGQVHIAIMTSVQDGKKFNWNSQEYEYYTGGQRNSEFKSVVNLLTRSPGSITWECCFDAKYHHRLDSMCMSDIINCIENMILKKKPEVLMIPAESWDQDHRTVHQACISVIRPHFFKGAAFLYEVIGEPMFAPNVFLALDEEVVLRKIEAVSCYTSQTSQKLHAISAESIFQKMKYRGKMVFEEFAEAFTVLRAVNGIMLY